MILARLTGEPAQVALAVSGGAAPAIAAVGALLVLCLQAVAEEVGWRGAPLTYAVERWGRAGLALHGAVWGVWYAPLLVHDSLATAVGFVITCMLLGIVFGWLRLRSRSVLPSAIANALLTIIAGLPVLLRDGSVGIRDAVFRWPGWPVLGVLAVVLLVARKHEMQLESRGDASRHGDC
jgi:membrane protease YdiL (CAAX protease family)